MLVPEYMRTCLQMMGMLIFPGTGQCITDRTQLLVLIHGWRKKLRWHSTCTVDDLGQYNYMHLLLTYNEVTNPLSCPLKLYLHLYLHLFTGGFSPL